MSPFKLALVFPVLAQGLTPGRDSVPSLPQPGHLSTVSQGTGREEGLQDRATLPRFTVEGEITVLLNLGGGRYSTLFALFILPLHSVSSLF